MAKELPYFEFEPAEYLSGNISFCSLEAQGLFILMCCYYWQRSCVLSQDQFKKRFDKPDLLDELLNENVIKLENGFISISFLNEKFEKATLKRNKNVINGSKGGRPKKEEINQNETQEKPNGYFLETQTKGIREDNIREDNKTEKKETKKVLLSSITIDDVPEEEKDFYKIALGFHKLFETNEKELGVKWPSLRKTTYKAAIDPIRLMIQNNEYTVIDLKKVYSVLIHDQFWKKNIRSCSKLREKMETLLTKHLDLDKTQWKKNIDEPYHPRR